MRVTLSSIGSVLTKKSLVIKRVLSKYNEHYCEMTTRVRSNIFFVLLITTMRSLNNGL